MTELSGSSNVSLGVWGRVRRFLLRDLSGSPSPPPQGPGVRVFRAPRYWERNVRGWPFATVPIVLFFLVLGGVLIGLTGTLPWISVLLILDGVAAPLVLFPGKVAALYPYAVVIEEGTALRLYNPSGVLRFPLDQVKGVRWSWVYGAWVIAVKRRYGLLSGFLIHFAWARQGRELAQAIGEELAHGA